MGTGGDFAGYRKQNRPEYQVPSHIKTAILKQTKKCIPLQNNNGTTLSTTDAEDRCRKKLDKKHAEHGKQEDT